MIAGGYLDRGVSGRRRQRPALDRALAELRDGDEFVVTKLDRLGRSLRDLLDIADQIRREGASLTVGRTTYDPADPVGAMMFQVLGMTAEFEVAMNRARRLITASSVCGLVRGVYAPRGRRALTSCFPSLTRSAYCVWLFETSEGEDQGARNVRPDRGRTATVTAGSARRCAG
ncbi:recombinase family protein [Dietzia timorensis]|uniref:recombinase family protein n=1 Tax=Dietzia timorensis TaxID=499555 RepID=UPI00096A6465|nr:recombinase family protein [Dietzia timorensis]